MSYSRKGWWLAIGASVLMLGLWLITVRLGNWTMVARGVSLIAVTIIAAALAIRAFFFQDEIQKLARMREWYFGSLAGFLAAACLVICIRMFPALFLTWLHSTQIHLVSLDRSLIIGVAGGVAMTLAMQVIGAFFARAIAVLRSGI